CSFLNITREIINYNGTFFALNLYGEIPACRVFSQTYSFLSNVITSLNFSSCFLITLIYSYYI
ncbi:MAG: hypothetical protein KAX18_10355, partial [Candidatus Lokiarchaeota archaeon]|nr:hypothetical protein [Candidatus Lokiarchaeota archaeon]